MGIAAMDLFAFFNLKLQHWSGLPDINGWESARVLEFMSWVLGVFGPFTHVVSANSGSACARLG